MGVAVLGGSLALAGLVLFGTSYGPREGLLVWLAAALTFACVVGIGAPFFKRPR